MSQDQAKSASRGIPRILVIDGFRGYAILGVVLIHVLLVSGALAGTAGTPSGIAVWGVLGNSIDVFFIASGFVLFMPFVARGGRLPSIRDYAIGRAIRLLPTYWFALVVCLALVALFPLDAREELVPGAAAIGLPGLDSVSVHFLGLQMPARMFGDGLVIGFGINGPLWMISVIIGFYIVLPIVARGYFRHPVAGLLVALAVTVLWKELVIHSAATLSALQGGQQPFFAQLAAIDQLPGWTFSFALGMTGAWAYYRFGQEPLSRPVRRLLIGVGVLGAVAFSACAYAYGSEASEVNAPISGAVARLDVWLGVAYTLSRAVVMAAIVLGPLWLKAPFINRPVAKLAELGYGLYVIHFPVAIYVGSVLLDLPRGARADALIWSAVVIPLSLALAYLVERFVERPTRSWWRRRAAASSQPAPSDPRPLVRS